MLLSHSVLLELERNTGSNQLKIAKAFNFIGYSARHFYMRPSSKLDEYRLRSYIRNIVRVIKSRRGNGHVPSWSLQRSFTPPIDHECPYIYTLLTDPQVRNNTHRIMKMDTKTREDDATRLQARARMASFALTLGLMVMEVPGDGIFFLTCNEVYIIATT